MKHILLFTLLFFAYYSSGQIKIDEATIKEAVVQVAGKHQLSTQDIEEYRVSDLYTQKRNGSTHIYLLQTINGLDIFNAQIQLHFSKNGKLVFSNSSFITAKNSKVNATSAVVDIHTAFLKVMDTLSIPSADQAQLKFDAVSPGNYKLVKDDLFFNPVRIKLGYELVSGALVLVYQFSVEPRVDKRMYVVKVDAVTGKVVRIINRTLDCKFEHAEHSDRCILSVPLPEFPKDAPVTPKSGASYNALPLGVESPIHGSRSILTNVENPEASPFGWHDTDGITGADYHTTYGNNVFTYEDTANANDIGYSPDGGPTLNFDFPLNLNSLPVQNMDASLTNLFVWNNFMHDVSYYYGFDEESGNFQMNNYGNGGSEMDPVAAEGLDGGGYNNANFATPEDGISPRMQMYIWLHGQGDLLTIHAPASVSGVYEAGIPSFGLAGDIPAVTADVVLANSWEGNPYEACGFMDNSEMSGKIVLIDRGTCSYVDKAMNAQNAGAVGVIIVNNLPGGIMSMGGTSSEVTIPVISVSFSNGNLIKSALLNGVVSATIGGTAEIKYIDGSFDNGVVSHEYGHGISTRLTGGPSQVDCLWNGEQAGEGWSDFFSLIMTNTPASSAVQARGIGNFASNFAFDGNGIRLYPYSRDLSINPMTYSYVGTLALPHGIGTVWCSMLWDLYWNMIDKHGNSNDLYATAGGNNKAIQLVMEGLRMQVCEPGFVDSRDAILAADELLFNGENSCLIWKTFARRGLGYSADQGSSSVVGDEIEAFDLPASCLNGVEEIESFDFNVYPVPASDVLKVTNTKGITIDQLVVFDLSGKEILRKAPMGAEGKLDVSNLGSGVYLIQIKVGGTSFQKRFVIM